MSKKDRVPRSITNALVKFIRCNEARFVSFIFRKYKLNQIKRIVNYFKLKVKHHPITDCDGNVDYNRYPVYNAIISGSVDIFKYYLQHDDVKQMYFGKITFIQPKCLPCLKYLLNEEKIDVHDLSNLEYGYDSLERCVLEFPKLYPEFFSIYHNVYVVMKEFGDNDSRHLFNDILKLMNDINSYQYKIKDLILYGYCINISLDEYHQTREKFQECSILSLFYIKFNDKPIEISHGGSYDTLISQEWLDLVKKIYEECKTELLNL